MKSENQLDERAMRELDAWLAEHVMGYVRMKDPETHIPRHVELIRAESVNNMRRRFGMEPTSDPLTIKDAPRYTTDPAAAIDVLEKCRKKCVEISNSEKDYAVRITSDVDGWWFAVCEQTFMDSSCVVGPYSFTVGASLFAQKLFAKE